MNQNRVFAMLGLAQRAGRLVSGEFATEKSIKEGSACLVVLASDASDNTKKKFTNSCRFYQVAVCVYGTKEELGHAIGKDIRSSLSVTDEGFARSLSEMCGVLDNEKGDQNG